MKLWDTAQVAEEVGFSKEWVREHAAELGGIRTGRSKHSRLRFEPARVQEWKDRRRLAPVAPESPQRRGKSTSPAGVELLPLPAGR